MSKVISAQPDFAKIERKLAALPSIEGLRAEADPHEMDAETFTFACDAARMLLEARPQCEADYNAVVKAIQKRFRKVASKSMMLAGYRQLTTAHPEKRQEFLEEFLVSKAPRSNSGVLVVTVFTSAFPEVNGKKQAFSCEWNCYYCPNEPNQPRSYLLNEPGVRRANRLDFDPIRQFDDRVRALVSIGHPADKIELLVLGGTWESYPKAYREKFVRDLYFAANTFFDEQTEQNPRRDPLTLYEEQRKNENAACKIIGLTLETRPDTINNTMLVDLRRLGCTRVQIGVQHTNDGILKTVNRQATRADTVNAIRLLKDACFKVDIHLMPDLPGSTPELDKAMFEDVLNSPDLQVDQWKIYPCQTTPFTVIQKWYEEGKYASYGLEKLIEVILFAKRRVHPWIRLNRVIRDIPVEYVLEGIEVSNLRQLLQERMKAEGHPCRCIRCREVKSDKNLASQARKAVLKRREFASSAGTEVFLSYETPDESTIFGFLRLRFPRLGAGDESVASASKANSRAASPQRREEETAVAKETPPFPELEGCALIRELHVYGNLVAANALSANPLGRQQQGDRAGAVQHAGIGSKLLVAADHEAVDRGYKRIAVISGIGVRNFYCKRGFALVDPERGGFLVKSLEPHGRLDAVLQSALGSAAAVAVATDGLVAGLWPMAVAALSGKGVRGDGATVHAAQRALQLNLIAIGVIAAAVFYTIFFA